MSMGDLRTAAYLAFRIDSRDQILDFAQRKDGLVPLQPGNIGEEGAHSATLKGRILAVSAFLMAVSLASAPPVTDAPAENASANVVEPTPAPPEAAAEVPASVSLPTAPPSVVADTVAPDEILVTAKRRAIAADPLENLNETSFKVIQSVDKAFVGPVAIAYREKVPGPLRSGIRNFLSNIGEPIVFVNFLLQLKPGKAMETAGRFAINSTIGAAGLFDVAKKKPFNLPHRVNGFAYTMGYYGIKSGPYLYLPFIGPTTLRDVTGRLMDLSLLPLAIGKPFNNPYYAIPAGILSSLDDRAEFDEELTRLRTQSNDPYAALRAYYLNRRQAEIDALKGISTPPPVTPPPLIAPAAVPSAATPPAEPSPAQTPPGSASPADAPSAANVPAEGASPATAPSGSASPSSAPSDPASSDASMPERPPVSSEAAPVPPAG